MSNSDSQRTYVRAGNFVGQIKGVFEPKSKYQTFVIFDAINDKFDTCAALCITPLSGPELEAYREKVENINAIRQEALERKKIEELEKVRSKHIEFLVNRGLELSPDAQYSQTRKLFERHHRASHCWSCKTSVDNEADEECLLCRWIICRSCGACGCGYKR